MRWNIFQGKPLCRFDSGSWWIDPSSHSTGYAHHPDTHRREVFVGADKADAIAQVP